MGSNPAAQLALFADPPIADVAAEPPAVELPPELVGMTALTLWQPWGSLVVFGPKRIENRTWQPPRRIIGTRIAIHAGKQFQDGAPGSDSDHATAREHRGHILGTVLVTGFVTERPSGDQARWWVGPIGWTLDDVRPLDVLIPWKGSQGLWTIQPTSEKA